jgi:deazaflavin-dependent oxidoreductase (nitroreductase family)
MADRPAASPTVADQPAPPGGFLRWLLGMPALLYRAHLGWMLGHRFLLLVHRGRRSGRRYETVLEVVRHDRSTRESTVVAGWGRRTAWLHNVEAGGAIEVRTGRDRYSPAIRRLDVDEALAVVGEYERRMRLAAPLVRAVLTRLLGWRYDGSDRARRRLVRQLPLLALRPST